MSAPSDEAPAADERAPEAGSIGKEKTADEADGRTTLMPIAEPAEEWLTSAQSTDG